ERKLLRLEQERDQALQRMRDLEQTAKGMPAQLQQAQAARQEAERARADAETRLRAVEEKLRFKQAMNGKEAEAQRVAQVARPEAGPAAESAEVRWSEERAKRKQKKHRTRQVEADLTPRLDVALYPQQISRAYTERLTGDVGRTQKYLSACGAPARLGVVF